MKDFLTSYAQYNQNLDKQSADEIEKAFTRTIELLVNVVDGKPFRIKTALNAAVFDSIMTGLSKRLAIDDHASHERVKEAYKALLASPAYLQAVSKATAREDQVTERLKLAINAFAAT